MAVLVVAVISTSGVVNAQEDVGVVTSTERTGSNSNNSGEVILEDVTTGVPPIVQDEIIQEEEEGDQKNKIVEFFDQTSTPVSSKGQCRMFGHCGESPDDPSHTLNCAVTSPPQELDTDSMHTLELFCPEIIQKYGNELCCNAEQVVDLVSNLALPQTIIGRCPTCFYNFRQAFCELACSPNQYQFLNVSKVVYNEHSKSFLKF